MSEDLEKLKATTTAPAAIPPNSGPRYLKPSVIPPFAGRIGGNQEFILDPNDPQNASVLSKVPDAAPFMTLRQSIDLHGFHELELWKAGVVEGIGTLLVSYLTSYINISPSAPPALPSTTSTLGIFSTSTFLGPLIGGITNAITLTLLIYCFSSVSGGHLNPLITLGTLFARLTTLPRATIYISFQVLGATLAGLLLRASYDSRAFKVGGCFAFTTPPYDISISSIFTTEFVSCLTLLFFAFGVGLDPRQRQIFGPALAPLLVGLSLGIISFGTGFSRPGYGGAGVNPARCFAVYVGSEFPGWHWVHWVASLAAALTHAVFYAAVPPWGMDDGKGR